jgi:hypothetical protein
MERQEKNTFISLKWDRYSLIVVRNNCFQNLITWGCCRPADLELLELQNVVWNQCLEELRKNKCEYIIAWFNEQEVFIYNKLRRVHTYWNEKFIAWYTYWIKKPNNYVVAWVENMVRRYYRISVMPRRCLYDLLVEANNTGYITENELVIKRCYKKKTQEGWNWLNRQQQMTLKQLKMYTARTAELWEKDERDTCDWNEFTMLRQKFNVRNAIKINKILKEWTKEEMDRIIRLVKTEKNYREVINKFA